MAKFRVCQDVKVSGSTRNRGVPGLNASSFTDRPDEVCAEGPTESSTRETLRRIIAGGCQVLNGPTQTVQACTPIGDARVTEIQKPQGNWLIRLWHRIVG